MRVMLPYRIFLQASKPQYCAMDVHRINLCSGTEQQRSFGIAICKMLVLSIWAAAA